jgi:hypothetical protein
MARSNSISQDAFFVAPQLIGLPLASGKRRLAAMLLDLLLVAILVNLGGGTLLGLAAAVFFFRIATRGAASRLPKALRVGVALVGAFILIQVVSGMWDSAARRLKGATEVAVSAGDSAKAPVQAKMGPMQVIGMTSALAQLSTVRTERDAQRLGRQATTQLRAAGQSDAQIRELYRNMAEEDEMDRPWLLGALLASLPAEQAAPAADEAPKAAPDSVAAALAAALRQKRADTTALKRAMVPIVASDTLAALQERIEEVSAERAEAKRDLREARQEVESYENLGLLSTIGKVADELGLGFGWTGLYFTTLLALGRGQTPGKRVMGIRVMRLNGERITYWASFERFGGYAASIFTGLLGFIQILWDRNRQGIHDKIVETVVVRDFGNLLAPNVPAVPERVPVPNPAHTAAVLANQAAARHAAAPGQPPAPWQPHPNTQASRPHPTHPPTSHAHPTQPQATHTHPAPPPAQTVAQPQPSHAAAGQGWPAATPSAVRPPPPPDAPRTVPAPPSVVREAAPPPSPASPASRRDATGPAGDGEG